MTHDREARLLRLLRLAALVALLWSVGTGGACNGDHDLDAPSPTVASGSEHDPTREPGAVGRPVTSAEVVLTAQGFDPRLVVLEAGGELVLRNDRDEVATLVFPEGPLDRTGATGTGALEPGGTWVADEPLSGVHVVLVEGDRPARTEIRVGDLGETEGSSAGG